ncbi:hypothetical protein OHB02_26465 [Streptomyces albidoflavus]|uniref:hypothetical protein n=1 Tax=Streptomyces TaxID=1883 RepID=UPI001E284306|nr:hypothetical protein [Streptomyces sp. OUCMDZ-3434]WSB23481.1 hypothetical protein OHB02_26465 [Streptomyces albidoflavus]
MTAEHLSLLLGGLGAVVCVAAGWLARTQWSKRRLRRRQAFLGLPDHSESLLVVGRDGGGPEPVVSRPDVFALLELAALVKRCRAHTRIVPHDTAQQGFGERTEFCVGHPSSNRRMAAHLTSLLPGVRINTEPEPGPDRGAFLIGGERYRMEQGVGEHVLLARLTGGQGGRPVFLFCGQRPITPQAATRYLARHHEKLARKHGTGTFVLLLKVVNSAAYGSDVVELVADVTKAAQEPAPAPAARSSHRAK